MIEKNPIVVRLPKMRGRAAKKYPRHVEYMVLHNRARILSMRAIGMTWAEIADCLKTSTSGLCAALNRIEQSQPDGELPNILLLTFNHQHTMLMFKELFDEFQSDNPNELAALYYG
jgi:hypothetical protein